VQFDQRRVRNQGLRTVIGGLYISLHHHQRGRPIAEYSATVRPVARREPEGLIKGIQRAAM
jgi:hypothetical protein